MEALIRDKEDRLSSRRYKFKDLTSASPSFANIATTSSSRQGTTPGHTGPKDYSGRYVFPNDAEDIKAHKWFRGIPWDRLHQLQPPFVPCIRSVDDTHYFDEEEEVSDWSDSRPTEVSEDATTTIRRSSRGHAHQHANADSSTPLTPAPLSSPLRTDDEPNSNQTPTPTTTSTALRQPPTVPPPPPFVPHPNPHEAREAQAELFLGGLGRSAKKWALAALAQPYDAARIQSQLDALLPGLDSAERARLRQFVRLFARKDRKRPRDRLLRDRATRAVAMDVRRRTAFMGYSWRRMRPQQQQPPPAVVAGTAAALPAAGPSAGVDGMFEREGLRYGFGVGYGYVGGGAGGDGGWPEEYDYGGCAPAWTGRGAGLGGGAGPRWGNGNGNVSSGRAPHGKGRLTWR